LQLCGQHPPKGVQDKGFRGQGRTADRYVRSEEVGRVKGLSEYRKIFMRLTREKLSKF